VPIVVAVLVALVAAAFAACKLQLLRKAKFQLNYALG